MRGPVARLVGIALAASCGGAALAAPAERYEDGVSAYQKNDFDRSLKTLRPLAERGDVRAQYMLGRHYQFGQGVKADKAEAYYWYKRAEARGHLESKLFRQLLEKRWKLSAEERARGERKLAELNAPKSKPEKPKTEIAARQPAREPAVRESNLPAITSKPAEPPAANPPNAAPSRGATEAARFTAPLDRNDANRAATRRPAVDDDDDGDTRTPDVRTSDVRTYRPGPAPAETRAALPPARDDGMAEIDTPAYNPPAYTPPSYTPPAYAAPNYPAPSYPAPGYAPNYPPQNYAAYPPTYYAPGAGPSWRMRGYYTPPPAYYGPRPGWGYGPRAYWQGGWRGAAWGPRYGFRGYRR